MTAITLKTFRDLKKFYNAVPAHAPADGRTPEGRKITDRTRALTEDELDEELDIIRTQTMERGRRYGLGMKALEFAHLPGQERLERLKHLLGFICDAENRPRQNGEGPTNARNWKPSTTGRSRKPMARKRS